MQASKSSGANIFGTFLETVSPGSSKPSGDSPPSGDLSKMTEAFRDFLKTVQALPAEPAAAAAKPEETGQEQKSTPASANPPVIPRLLRAIADAKAALSIVTLVKATGLDVDAAAAALRDATAAGLLQAEEGRDGSRLFGLTPAGKELLGGS